MTPRMNESCGKHWLMKAMLLERMLYLYVSNYDVQLSKSIKISQYYSIWKVFPIYSMSISYYATLDTIMNVRFAGSL